MPLLPRRRSTLDILTANLQSTPSEDAIHQATPQPSPNHLAPAPTQTLAARPVSEHGLLDLPGTGAARPDTPPKQEANAGTRRFSMMKWRTVSDTQLSAKARLHAAQEEKPPMPAMPTAPAIITTAPTVDMDHSHGHKKQKTPFKRQLSKMATLKAFQPRKSMDERREKEKETPGESKSLSPFKRSHEGRNQAHHLHRMSTASSGRVPTAPPAYGEENANLQVHPVSRMSDSSRSDRSSGEHVYATTTTHHTITSTATFFKMGRKAKKQKPLFPLPMKIPPPPEFPDTAPATPRASTSANSTRSHQGSPSRGSPSRGSPSRASRGSTPTTALQRRHTDAVRFDGFSSPLATPTHTALARFAVTFAAPGATLFRNDSSHSTQSARSSPVLSAPRRLGIRDRSSTMSSLGRPSEDMTPPTPPTLGSARNSTSTSGRASLGNFLSLSRFRHGSDPHSPRHSPGTGSKSNSFAMSRETLPIPEREEGDTPGKYLERLEAAASRSLIAGLMSKSSDPFHQAVLRSYTRRFPFFGEPIDMSLRKFLLEAELPKETQQVDRVIQAFADRYHECNPGIFVAPDQAYVIAFSLMMLHTDAFNKNNKHKMQKSDYIKNTSGQHVSEDVLACFYDNICYTPFIHFEEDVDFNGEKVQHTFKSKTTKLKGAITDPVKKPSGPVDPYALICDSKLDLLRPSIKDSISMDDPYSYLGTAKSLDVSKLLQAFVNTGVLQIISARSRPAAFESEASRENPDEAKPGVVDLNITKVGILWRKSTKRKKARSPWQEWGGILTGSQLYLFKNAPWVKNLMHQQHVHLKQGHGSSPVVFKPPLTEFKPDALIKTDDAVALHDSSYIRHKHAFTLVRHGGQEEVFLAESEAEMNDWLALINYAAAFRSAGVRIRGFIAGNEGAGNHGMIRSLRKLESSHSAHSLGPSQLENQRQISHQLATQVMAARRQIILQRISEAEKQIAEAKKRLDDLLRDARHLQVLAPIQPRTREGVIHAAARMDAMLKWVRREIWRTKCHKDILALDVQEDGPTNADATENADSNVAVPPTPESIVHHPGPRRLSSKASISVPKSPQSPTQLTRPGTKSSSETFFANDAFKTPPEHAQQDSWHLPALHIDTSQSQTRPPPQHRPSVASTAPSTASHQHTLAPPSSTGSVLEFDGVSRLGSTTPISFRDREAVKLAMDGLEPTYTAASSIGPHASHDFPIEKATPESTSKRQSVRRSLHRSLREGVGHTPSSAHRHRKGKESASTVRSDASRAEDLPEGTPGLERSGKKFIVHGKQASVITFGGDWAEEKMRLRREVALQRLHGAASESESGPDANLRAHVARELGEDFTDGYSVTSDDTTTARSASLSRDTELADAYVTAPATRRGSEGAGRTSPTLPISDDEALDSYFDVNAPHAAGKPRPEDRRRTLMRAPKSKEAVTAPEAEAEQSDGASASHDDDVFGDAERPGSRLTFTLGPVTPNEDEKGEGKGKGVKRIVFGDEDEKAEEARLMSKGKAQAVEA